MATIYTLSDKRGGRRNTLNFFCNRSGLVQLFEDFQSLILAPICLHIVKLFCCKRKLSSVKTTEMVSSCTKL